MKRPERETDGYYHIGNKKYRQLFGSRKQVFLSETAYKTPGGLTKKDLMINRHRRIVSRKKHVTAKKERRLEAHGYFTKKGKFGWVRKTVKNKSRKNK